MSDIAYKPLSQDDLLDLDICAWGYAKTRERNFYPQKVIHRVNPLTDGGKDLYLGTWCGLRAVVLYETKMEQDGETLFIGWLTRERVEEVYLESGDRSLQLLQQPGSSAGYREGRIEGGSTFCKRCVWSTA